MPDLPDLERAAAFNEQGTQLGDEGDLAGAESAYRAAIAAAPDWPAPVYNLGLLCKYARRWPESLAYNREAARLQPEDEASWWNLGIAATALSDWPEARRAWAACGIDLPPGEGAPELDWGATPVRLEPDGDGEVVWARRLDPARARILSIPLPTSPFHWGDIVLTDGAVDGERVVNGRSYPVFNVLDLWRPSGLRTFVVELATADREAIAALERCAEERGGAAEDWGTCTRILCADCSHGRPHEHPEGAPTAAHPHCGVAARDHAHADEIIAAWLASAPTADLTAWYQAPEQVPDQDT